MRTTLYPGICRLTFHFIERDYRLVVRAMASPNFSIMRIKLSIWITIAGLLILFVIGLGMRRNIYNAQQRMAGMEMPFTLESALQFRMTEMVAADGKLPTLDAAVAYPDGVDMRKTYSVGAEHAYVGLSRLLPKAWSFTERVRWAALLIFCLGIPAIALYAGILFNSRPAGLVAGFVYAVSIASVQRSTGQELSRENFAMPFLLAFLAMDVLAERSDGRRFWICSIGSGVLIALAMMHWDMIQYMLGLWIILQYVHLTWLASPQRARKVTQKLCIQTLCLFFVGIANPYLFAHRFLLSPVMGLLAGVLLAALLFRTRDRVSALVLRGALPLLVLLGFVIAGALYNETYGHFGELLKAKVVHMNIKPQSPELLTFNQRIMWTPALHSANWQLTKQTFPGTLILTAVGMVVLVISHSKKSDFTLLHPIFYCLACLATYFLFFRFHVFLIIAMAVIIGGWTAFACKSQDWKFLISVMVILTGLGVETYNTGVNPGRWGRFGNYKVQERYTFINELTGWLKDHAAGEPVLANFGIGGPILAYAGCPIILHPKFEGQEIRTRVEEYGETLFKGSEEKFKSWADRYGARYLVFSPGEFYEKQIDQQMRYMVNAIHPSPESAAFKLQKKTLEEFLVAKGMERKLPRDFLRYFKYEWGNGKYAVYRIVTDDDQELARQHGALALKHLQHGDLESARKRALSAIQHDFLDGEAYWVLEKVQRLQAAGVRSALP
ncbi:MAG: hypothetical protein ACI9TH_003696 [Kiritimatiellia bacterium]|jgi:hypothetical protein